MRQITIIGKYPSINEYVAACRRNQYAGASMIKESERDIIEQLKTQKVRPFKPPIHISYFYFETSRRRDKDNISGYFHKVFQDALVKAGLLPDDGWNYISGFSDSFGTDKHPYIEIEIREENEKKKQKKQKV